MKYIWPLLLVMLFGCNYKKLSITDPTVPAADAAGEGDSMPPASTPAPTPTQTATPIIALTSPAATNARIVMANASTYNFTGTCVYNAGDVVISDGASFSATIACPSNGIINENIDLSSIPDGTVNLTITQTNDLSTSSQISLSLENLNNSCLAAAATVPYSGTGAVMDPYLICTTTQFNAIKANLSSGKYYKLANNLDFNSIAVTSIATVAGNDNDDPDDNMGFGDNYFDGNYLSMKNIDLEADSLFGNFSGSGYVRRLTLDSMILRVSVESAGLVASILSDNSYLTEITITSGQLLRSTLLGSDKTNIGGMVGITMNNSYISDSTVNITLDGDGSPGFGFVGGLVGYSVSSGTFSGITVSGSVKGTNWIGGAFGTVNRITLNDAVVSASLQCGGDFCGGVIGSHENDGTFGLGSIVLYNTHKTGMIRRLTGTGNYIGGLVGKAQYGNFELCSFHGIMTITGNGDGMGGLIGAFEGPGASSTFITNSYVNAIITGSNIWSAGGITAWSTTNTTIDNVYTFGSLTIQQEVAGLIDGDGGGSGNIVISNAISQMSLSAVATFGLYPAGNLSCSSDCYTNSDYVAGPNPMTTAQLNALVGTALALPDTDWKVDTSIAPYPILIWVY